MADDGKRTELVCVKVTERMALDLLRLSTSQDRSTSDFLFGVIRQRQAAQFTTSDKVNQPGGEP